MARRSDQQFLKRFWLRTLGSALALTLLTSIETYAIGSGNLWRLTGPLAIVVASYFANTNAALSASQLFKDLALTSKTTELKAFKQIIRTAQLIFHSAALAPPLAGIVPQIQTSVKNIAIVTAIWGTASLTLGPAWLYLTKSKLKLRDAKHSEKHQMFERELQLVKQQLTVWREMPTVELADFEALDRMLKATDILGAEFDSLMVAALEEEPDNPEFAKYRNLVAGNMLWVASLKTSTKFVTENFSKLPKAFVDHVFDSIKSELLRFDSDAQPFSSASMYVNTWRRTEVQGFMNSVNARLVDVQYILKTAPEVVTKEMLLYICELIDDARTSLDAVEAILTDRAQVAGKFNKNDSQRYAEASKPFALQVHKATTDLNTVEELAFAAAGHSLPCDTEWRSEPISATNPQTRPAQPSSTSGRIVADQAYGHRRN